jgi:TolB-like protein/tetratricopeptide (TPR) repeat protein
MPELPTKRGISRRTMIEAGAAAGALAATGAVGWAFKDEIFGDGPEPSIAVLPFKNVGANESDTYFTEGLTEEVRSALRRIAGLKVLAGTSSEAASEEKSDVRTMARKLDVAWLLEGSSQLAADRVRIAVDLTDGKTGFSKWSTKVDRRLTDIFALQSEIAAMVAQAMTARVVTAEPPRGGTHDIKAYEHFLRGRSLFNLGKDEPTDRAALAEYDAALAEDPKFALAHAARSRVIAAIAIEYAPAGQLKGLYDEAINAAQRAIDIEPKLAEAELAMGFALYTGRLDVAGARPFYERAYALANGNADILLLFALYCSRAGRAADAQAAIAQALTFDPLNPRTHRASGSIEYAARSYRAALAPLARALQLNPGLSNAHSLIGYCKMQLGDLPGAMAEFEAEPHAIFHLSGLAIVQRKVGDKAKAEAYFEQLVREEGDAAAYQQAQVLAQWGEANQAIAALQKARAVGDSGLIYLATDPMLDPIRGQPAFARFAHEIGLA